MSVISSFKRKIRSYFNALICICERSIVQQAIENTAYLGHMKNVDPEGRLSGLLCPQGGITLIIWTLVTMVTWKKTGSQKKLAWNYYVWICSEFRFPLMLYKGRGNNWSSAICNFTTKNLKILHTRPFSFIHHSLKINWDQKNCLYHSLTSLFVLLQKPVGHGHLLQVRSR